MKILVISALLLSIALPAMAQVGPAYSKRYSQYLMTTGTICTKEISSSLSLRSGPGRSYRVLAKIHNGNSVILEGERYGQDGFRWLQAFSKGQQGWIRADYVCKISTIATD
jgi:uncharacterized protein YgiM (DUF1202 family)